KVFTSEGEEAARQAMSARLATLHLGLKPGPDITRPERRCTPHASARTQWQWRALRAGRAKKSLFQIPSLQRRSRPNNAERRGGSPPQFGPIAALESRRRYGIPGPCSGLLERVRVSRCHLDRQLGGRADPG